MYASATATAAATITFLNTGDLGLNFFGFWWSDITSGGNSISFYRNNAKQFTLLEDTIIQATANIPPYHGQDASNPNGA